MTDLAVPRPRRRPRISLPAFHALLTEQHPFSLLLGIEVTQIGYGTARAVLPTRDSHQRLGGIIAGPMLMGLADLPRPPWSARPGRLMR